MARILLVDDDPDQVEIRRLLLETEGHEVAAAGGVWDAIRTFEDYAPEVAIVDLRIPRAEDGRVLIQELRSRSASLRIVVISGLAEELLQSPERRLVDEILQKPFASDSFLRLVGELASDS